MTETELKDQVRRLVAADNLDDALSLLAEHLADPQKLDDITLQIARLNELKKVRANGMIGHSEISQGLNQLRSTLLWYLRTETLTVKIPLAGKESTLQQFEEQMALSVTRWRVAEALAAEFPLEAGLTITEIQQKSRLKSRKLVVDFVNELVSAALLEKTKGDKTRWRLNEKGKAILKKIVEAD